MTNCRDYEVRIAIIGASFWVEENLRYAVSYGNYVCVGEDLRFQDLSW